MLTLLLPWSGHDVCFLMLKHVYFMPNMDPDQTVSELILFAFTTLHFNTCSAYFQDKKYLQDKG